MKFLHITIENFRAIASAEVKLADRGLVAIRGENKDDTSAVSNGAGKSTIGKALYWCLYGETDYGESPDDVVNNVAGKNCRVEVQVQDRDNTYRIVRHRKHKDGKNGVTITQETDGVVTDLTKGTNALTQVEIDKVIGCSANVFKSSIYAAQEAMPDLPGMTDRELKKLIEEASGSTALEAAYDCAVQELHLIDSDIELNRSAYKAAKRDLDSQNENINSILRHCREFDDNKVEETKKLEQIIDELREHVKVQKDWLEKNSIDKLLDEKDALIAEAERVAKVREELAEVTKDISALNVKITVGESRINTLTERCSEYKDQLKATEDVVISKNCSVCGVPLSTNAEEEYYKKEKARLAERIQEKLEAIEATKQTIKDNKVSLQKLEERRDELKTIVDSAKDVVERMSKINDSVVEYTRVEANYKSLTKEFADKVDLLHKKTIAPNPYHKSLEVATLKAEKIEEELKTLEVEYEELDQKRGIALMVKGVFAPSGVRARILDEVTPFLNEQTARYLSILTDSNIIATWSTLSKNSRGEYRERFAIDVEHVNTGAKFGSISGGEKRRVRIACALALQDLVARRASKPINLFFGDEIDDALDDAGLERLAQVLELKARERGSVFVISHNPNIRDWITQNITVVKNGKVATIEEELA